MEAPAPALAKLRCERNNKWVIFPGAYYAARRRCVESNPTRARLGADI